jgi:hypothetical protein
MPWSRIGDKHVFVQFNELVTQPSTLALGTSSHNLALVTSIPVGRWVQWTGEPITNNFWAENGSSGKMNNAHGSVELAEPQSRCVAGVVAKTNEIVTDGITLAWILKKKRTLELSGLYTTSENGVFVGNTAIIQRGNFFVMARSHDDDVETLTSKFTELAS